MSIYGKLAGALAAVTITGFGAAYVASAGNEVMADVNSIAQEASYYILCEHEGNIALFKEGESEPIAVYTAPMEDINPVDRQMLQEGIRISGMTEAARLIEDLDLQ